MFSHIKRKTVFLIFFDVVVKRKKRNGSITSHSFYPPQFTKSPRIPTYIFTTCHITPNTRSSLKAKLHSVGLTLTLQIKHSKLSNIRSNLRLNGFPTTTTFLSSTQYNHFTSISYIKGASEKVRRVLNEAGIKVNMKLVFTIDRILSSWKDPLDLEQKCCLVCQVACFDCDFCLHWTVLAGP